MINMYMYKRRLAVYLCVIYISVMTGLCIGKFISNKTSNKGEDSHRIDIMSVSADDLYYRKKLSSNIREAE